MSLISRTKFGNCTQCSSTNVACVKVAKSLVCVSCHRINKGQTQITKANERDRQRQLIESKSRKEVKQIKTSVKTQVRSLISSDTNKKGVTKSMLLKTADAAFSRYIRNRDKDKNGNIACVCCGKIYNIEQVTPSGDRIVQCLHFIKRSVYSLRFDEDNCAAGCTYCNNNMDKNPTGKAYQQFKEKLISDFGETQVAEMEVAHRKINKLEESQLKNIIEHYQ